MRAKIAATTANLGPGFDCLGMSLNFYNYIDFEQTNKTGEILIKIEGEGEGILEENQNNLTYQAYRKVFDYLGEPIAGIKLNCINNIPLARGLGSSAAAVVGGLLIANFLLGNQLSSAKLLDLAVELEGHPDNVAPALFGGIVISATVGEEIIYKKIKPPKGLRAMILVPDYQLSTTKARKALPQKIDYQDAVFNIGRVSLLINAFHTEDLDLLSIAMQDKLHHPYRSALIPGFNKVLQITRELGLLGTAISGAGPSILIFYKKEELEKANQLQSILGKHDLSYQVYFLEPTNQGANIQ